MDDLAGGNLSLDGIEEADELLVPVLLHAAADDRASRTFSAANSVVASTTTPPISVEDLFAKLIKRRLRRGVFRSVVELQTAINRFIAEANHQPKPFVRTADPDKIIAAVNREHQVSDSIH